MEAYFQENYNQFLKLKNNSTKKARNKAEAKDIFKSHVDTVRAAAYKNYNNCTSFPTQDFEYIQKHHRCMFQNHIYLSIL